jgi:FtsZ-binding cell division protein ZapB
LSDEVERLQEQCNRLKTENSDICRSRERMSSQYQKEVNNLVASHTDNERIAHAQFEEELRNVREEILKS